MSDSGKQMSGSALIWRQFLIGQTFGVVFAVLLFVVEPVWLARSVYGQLGASLKTVFAAYTAFGWVVGAVVGVAWGLVGAVWRRLVRPDGAVPGAGPFLGFLFMALFIVRLQSVETLKTFPSSIMTSLVAAVLVWVGIGYLGRRFAHRYVPVGSRDKIRMILGIAAFVVFIGSVGSSRLESKGLPKRTAASASSPNVVMIVVDALRPDHLQVYGYERETSPNLQRFAERATVFENAYSQGNRTIIAMPSLFTSLYPSFHGAVGFQERMIPLPQSRTTISEVIRDAGYTTVGVMSNVYLKSAFGLTQGFDAVDEFESLRYQLSVYRALTSLGIVKRPIRTSFAPDATEVTDSGIHWLHNIKDRPFFLYLHYMDVHHPYYPPPENELMFNSTDSDVDSRVLFAKTAAMVRNPPPLTLPGEELRRLIDLYDGCIRYTDEEIGRFLQELESLDVGRETVVVFTSDHGDEFLEHGSLYHTNLAIETLVRVPLIVGRFPAPETGNRVASLVRHVDVLPTIAQIIGAKTPANIHGVTLTPLLEGGSASVAEYSIAEGDFCTSLNMSGWKLMYVDSTGAYQLYYLADDPLGLKDVSGRFPDKVADMRAILDEYLASVAELDDGTEEPLSEEAIRQLKALGYLQ
jgi:arylsulfatase A-like enzyme